MSRVESTTVESVLTSLFPAASLRRTAKEAGAQRRQRKVDVVSFFWTLVLGFGVSKERTLAGLRRTYENLTSTKIEESSFYDRFTPGVVKWLRGIVGDALERVATDSRRVADSLSGFRDLLLIDSTVIRLHDLLIAPEVEREPAHRGAEPQVARPEQARRRQAPAGRARRPATRRAGRHGRGRLRAPRLSRRAAA